MTCKTIIIVPLSEIHVEGDLLQLGGGGGGGGLALILYVPLHKSDPSKLTNHSMGGGLM